MKLIQLLPAAIVALVIGAYPLLASLMSLLGALDTQFPSVVLRTGIAVASVFVLWINRDALRIRNPMFLACLGVFWAAYLFRIIHDGYIAQDMIDVLPAFLILVYTLVFVAVPIMPSLAGLTGKGSQACYVFLFLITLVTTALIVFDSRELLFNLMERNLIRFQLTKLNPISVGIVGGTMILLCTVAVFNRFSLYDLRNILYVLAGAAGLFVLMIAASRGPVISVVVALVFYWFIPIGITRLIVGASFASILILVVMRFKNFILRKFDFDISTRFISAVDNEDDSIDTRKEAFIGSWEQFSESPLFGDALFENITQTYPHNLVLEAFLATGIFGGLAYLICLGFMFVAAVRILYRAQGHEWLALLAIFFTIESQFTGSHWLSGAHWVTLVAIVATEAAIRDSSHEHEYSSRHHSRRRRKRRRKPGTIKQIYH